MTRRTEFDKRGDENARKFREAVERHKRLVVVFDVSDFTETQIENLRFSALVQGEADVGLYPHPDASANSYVVGDPVKVAAIDRDVSRSGYRTDVPQGYVGEPATGHYNPTTGQLELTGDVEEDEEP